ncbi:MAG: NADPH-dependent FMN reductase [Taibaiella sp.]|jgi:NAD(P)H-dependent FMN reductase
MNDTIKILAISGSTRKASSNLNLIKAISELAHGLFTIDIFDGLTDLPQFNPDDDNEHVAVSVTVFREKLRVADGILICTPEYAIGVPGSLKNAIDWTVSSMEFSKKPVALITASLSGERAHQSLLGTLLITESLMTEHTQLLIPFIKSKVNEQGITDKDTLDKVNQLIQSFAQLITHKDNVDLLPEPILMNDGVNSGK